MDWLTSGLVQASSRRGTATPSIIFSYPELFRATPQLALDAGTIPAGTINPQLDITMAYSIDMTSYSTYGGIALQLMPTGTIGRGISCHHAANPAVWSYAFTGDSLYWQETGQLSAYNMTNIHHRCHIIVENDNTSGVYRLYRDGVLVFTSAGGHSANNTSYFQTLDSTVYLMGNGGQTQMWWEMAGYLRNVKVFNGLLSGEEKTLLAVADL